MYLLFRIQNLVIDLLFCSITLPLEIFLVKITLLLPITILVMEAFMRFCYFSPQKLLLNLFLDSSQNILSLEQSWNFETFHLLVRSYTNLMKHHQISQTVTDGFFPSSVDSSILLSDLFLKAKVSLSILLLKTTKII